MQPEKKKTHLGKTNGSRVALLKKLFQGDAEMFLGGKISQVLYSSLIFAIGSYKFLTVSVFICHICFWVIQLLYCSSPFSEQECEKKLPRQIKVFYSFFNLVLTENRGNS